MKIKAEITKIVEDMGNQRMGVNLLFYVGELGKA